MDYKEFLKLVIEGKWNSERKGFSVYIPSGEIISSETINNDVFLVDGKIVEDLLYKDCVRILEQFAYSENNKEVYAVTVFIDTEGGNNGISISTESSYSRRVSEAYSDDSTEDLTKIWGVRYNEGDFEFRYFNKDFISPDLKEIMNAYYCINCDHPILDVGKKIGFRKSFFEEELVQVGIRVVNRLHNTFNILNKTNQFISFVSLGDAGEETILSLMKQTVPSNVLFELFPKYK